MGLSTTKHRGVRVPLANTAPTVPQDLSGMRDDLTKYATRRTGTAAERAALTADERYVGLEFFETDTKRVYRFAASGWEEIALIVVEAPSGADAGNFQKPPAGAVTFQKVMYRKTFLSNGVFKVTFETPFPNKCVYASATTIEGSSVNPVVNARSMSNTAVDFIWPGAGNAVVAFTVLAIGY